MADVTDVERHASRRDCIRRRRLFRRDCGYVMALICSGLITLLFRLRDRLLSWQKGLVRWS
jgi:hypothetical protein